MTDMQQAKVEHLLSDLHQALASNERLEALLIRAIRLANLTGEFEYRLVFELHLNGVSETAGAQSISQWPDGGQKPKWNPVTAVFADRSVSSDKMRGDSVSGIEHLLLELSKARQQLPRETGFISSEKDLREVLTRIRNRVVAFATHLDRYRPGSAAAASSSRERGFVFIGHGRDLSWRELGDFLERRLKLTVLEFNRAPAAGISTTGRLEELLDDADFAFLVMTAEDQASDGTWRARENVVHEAGLFQGRLGFRRSILLLEDGCTEFSNIVGLCQIRFSKGRISAGFEEVRGVLEREKLISADGAA